MGILGISSNIIFELIAIKFPDLAAYHYSGVLGAIVIIGVFYAILLVGKYTFFEKILVLFVVIMGLSFLISLLLFGYFL